MKIRITVPQNEKEKWKLGIGARPRSMARADTVLNRIERQLLSRLILKEKVSIEVKYDKVSSNETIPSLDAHYLIYTTSCFLEDYLSKETLKRIKKLYFKK